jgi:hypothetical protein
MDVDTYIWALQQSIFKFVETFQNGSNHPSEKHVWICPDIARECVVRTESCAEFYSCYHCWKNAMDQAKQRGLTI